MPTSIQQLKTKEKDLKHQEYLPNNSKLKGIRFRLKNL